MNKFKFSARRINGTWEVHGTAAGEGFTVQVHGRGADMDSAASSILLAMWSLSWLTAKTAVVQAVEFALYYSLGRRP